MEESEQKIAVKEIRKERELDQLLPNKNTLFNTDHTHSLPVAPDMEQTSPGSMQSDLDDLRGLVLKMKEGSREKKVVMNRIKSLESDVEEQETKKVEETRLNMDKSKGQKVMNNVNNEFVPKTEADEAVSGSAVSQGVSVGTIQCYGDSFTIGWPQSHPYSITLLRELIALGMFVNVRSTGLPGWTAERLVRDADRTQIPNTFNQNARGFNVILQENTRE